MRFSLVDQMFLIGCGQDGSAALPDLAWLVGGAALTDLALRGRLDRPARTVEVLDATPTGHPALDHLLGEVSEVRRPRTGARWVLDTARRVAQAEQDHLVAEVVLESEQRPVLGVIPRVRHPLRDAEIQRGPVESLRALVLAPDVAAAAEQAPVETRLLASLVATASSPRRVAAALFPELDTRSLRPRLAAASQPHWAVDATARAVRLTHAARA